MFTQIKLELIGWKTWKDDLLQVKVVNRIVPGLGRRFKKASPWWVAEITGRDPKFKYNRAFVRPRVDYTLAAESFNRGVFGYYLVETGKFYEIKELDGECHANRYFLTVSETGEKIRITEMELVECLNSKNI